MTAVAALSVAALLVGACGSVNGATKSSGARRGPSGSVPVSFFGSEPSNVINMQTDWFTNYAEKKFGLKFTFDLVPSGDVATKEPLLMASGDYPDVIWYGSMDQQDAARYGSEGVFVPLNKLIRQYAPNVWRAIQTVPGSSRPRWILTERSTRCPVTGTACIAVSAKSSTSISRTSTNTI
jgi:putative aldouronate transport system substrate-binding protein